MTHTILDSEANKLLAAAKEVQTAADRLYSVVAENYGENSEEAETAASLYSDYQRGLAPILGATILSALAFKDGITAK